VDRRTAGTCGDTRLAQNGDRSALSQHVFERTQLSVDVPERCQLRQDERIVALSEPVQVEDQPAEVAIAKLPGLAQEARAPSCASA
jgi:hypothetical protein